MMATAIKEGVKQYITIINPTTAEFKSLYDFLQQYLKDTIGVWDKASLYPSCKLDSMIEEMFFHGFNLTTCQYAIKKLWVEADQPTLEKEKWLKRFRLVGWCGDTEPPEKPLLLYRGSVRGAPLGLSWTDNKLCAEWFAAKHNKDTGKEPVLYSALVLPETLLGRFSQKGEYEFVVDIDKLGANVDESIVINMMFDEQCLKYGYFHEAEGDLIKLLQVEKLLQIDTIRTLVKQLYEINDLGDFIEEFFGPIDEEELPIWAIKANQRLEKDKKIKLHSLESQLNKIISSKNTVICSLKNLENVARYHQDRKRLKGISLDYHRSKKYAKIWNEFDEFMEIDEFDINVD